MAKSTNGITGNYRVSKASGASKVVGASKVLGMTKDGVRILKPRGRPTHFSQSEIREAVASVRRRKPM
jgi:hypothetical protein